MKLAILLLALTLPLAAQSCSVEVVQGPPTFFSGDGGPASAAAMYGTESIAFDAKGNLYLAQTSVHRIRRITPDGIIQTVAGTGTPGFSGDGGPATQAQITYPAALAIDPSGRVYFSDNTARIRRLNLNGTIQTVVGFGVQGFNADRGPGTSIAVGFITSMTATPDGSIYYYEIFSTNGRIRRLRPDGIVQTVVGTSGKNAYNTTWSPFVIPSYTDPLGVQISGDYLPNVLASDADGNVYFISNSYTRPVLARLTPRDDPAQGQLLAAYLDPISYAAGRYFFPTTLSSGADRQVYLVGLVDNGPARANYAVASLNTDLKISAPQPLNLPSGSDMSSSTVPLTSDTQGRLHLLIAGASIGLLDGTTFRTIAGSQFVPKNVDGGLAIAGSLLRISGRENYFATDAAGNLLAVGEDLARL